MDLPNDVSDYARSRAGNWRKFESFTWSERPDENAEDWAIVYTHNRDSDLLEQANQQAIAKLMQPFLGEEDPDITEQDHSHWACGWVAGYAIRCFKNGEVTGAIGKYFDIQKGIEDYPVLDEELYSKLQDEALMRNIEQEVGFQLYAGEATDKPAPEPPLTIAGDVYDWLRENQDSELEDIDGLGAYPSGEWVAQALIALGYLEGEAKDLPNPDQLELFTAN